VKDAVALVAGASSDVGRAITYALVDAGLYVYALGRNSVRLAEIAAESPGRIKPVVADLVQGLDPIRQSMREEKRLDLLVLGSGIYERSRDSASLARQFAANVQGPCALLDAMLPLLVTAKGLVVFANSTQGLAASPGVGYYAATQHAMRAIADSTREEFNAKGVRVTSLFLGRIATARQEAIFALEQRPYKREALIQPADVARVIIDLLELPRTSEITEIRMRPRVKSY
jgi:NADP-dependent 3-hydroxy acid dehydrogenase YdfG